MFRRTKIVATLGPATDTPDKLKKLLAAGVNVVRLNFSHGSASDHIQRAKQVRTIAKELNQHIAILGDLQGPKIRIAQFEKKSVELKHGQTFILDSGLDKQAGNEQYVGIDYKELPQDLTIGDELLLDDGKIQLKVTNIDHDKVITNVIVAGKLSNNKGINKRGGGLSAEALTEKDKADIKTAAEINVDYLAVSFPRSSADLNYARELIREEKCAANIIAKVERAETVASQEAMDDIILASDGVMVARGDLGVEIGDSELVAVQKSLISRCRQLDRPVITATQMMESMITNSMPTRAEVMDVANAVLDGTDAVMLSAETASGDYPSETVRAMAEVCLGAERHPSTQISRHRLDAKFHDIEETTALTAMYAANQLSSAKAIVSLTESGNTPLLMSRISSKLPIIALSRHPHSLTRMALYRGVLPIYFDSSHAPQSELISKINELLQQRGYLATNDHVILTHGDTMGKIGYTNTCKVITVE